MFKKVDIHSLSFNPFDKDWKRLATNQCYKKW